MAIHSKIIGTGSALPPEAVSNEALAQRLAGLGVDTSDEWIVSRTGIRQRYLAAPGTLTSDLAVQAGHSAIAAAGIDPSSIDLIIVATSTPDVIFPSTACFVQSKLGISGGAAFDVQAVCSGFVYALATADSMIRTGLAHRALVIGAEVFSRILDWQDRTTCVLFGDGAGAVLLDGADSPGVLSARLHADGSQHAILCTAGQVSQGQVSGDPFLRMDGQAVFKLAVNVLGSSADEVLSDARMTPSDIDFLVPHQANIRILHATARRLGLPLEKLVVSVDEHANTSAASVPLALDREVRAGRVREGHVVLLQGVGGGFTWGSVLVRM